jgi:hypothetical protein
MQIFDRSSNVCNSQELVDARLQPLQIRTFYSHSHGLLKAPKGFYKLTNTILEQAHMSYELTSLAENEIPLMSGDNELEQQRKTADFFWKSAHYRFEILVSYDNGKNWRFRNALPLKRPEGFPVQTVRLLDLLSDTDIYRLTYGMLVGCRFRDVGYGIPKLGFDSCVIHNQGVCEETIYENLQQLVGTSTATFVREIQPLAANAFSMLCPARIGRKAITFSSPSNATASFTIRYGGVADTTAQTFTLTGGNTPIAGRSDYLGEISFNQVTAQANTRVQAIELSA